MTTQTLTTAILALHLGVVVFNVGGLVLVPVGGWRHWRWVRLTWLRGLHVLSLAVVALQALLGRACFLTIWQFALQSQSAGEPPPLIATWVNRMLYWPLPHWVFAAGYVAVFVATLLLWWWVPPQRAVVTSR